MSKYDLSLLNDKEFEQLVNDLLSAEFELHISRFKPGRDSGIDGRFNTDVESNCIIQSKHYLGTGYPGLKSKIINDEVNKILSLCPSKYILATSIGLTPNNVNELSEILSKAVSDVVVFGADDIDYLLDKYPQVLEKHFKLWIRSTSVLVNVLNHDVKNRSIHKLQQILDRSTVFVQTEEFFEAIQKLEKSRVLILSGEPGAGKTTLAENIALSFAGKGYEFIEISEKLSEAERIYRNDCKQLFYFDDFLGSNYLEAIENRSDVHVTDFIKRVEQSKDKLFILTSRTNVLNSGVLVSSAYSNKNIRKSEYVVDVNLISQLDKAKILYSHLWMKRMPMGYVDELYDGKRYRVIVDHRNFNPRLIEMLTDNDRLIGISIGEYWSYVSELLDNPLELWNQCFSFQCDEFSRSLVRIVVYNGGEILEDYLREASSKYIRCLPVDVSSKYRFSNCLKVVVGSLLRRDIQGGNIFLRVFNPSLSDFVISEIRENSHVFAEIVSKIGTCNSLKFLSNMLYTEVIDSTTYDEILLRSLECKHSDINYRVMLNSDVHEIDGYDNSREVLTLLEEILSKEISIVDVSGFVGLLREYRDKATFLNESMLERFIQSNEDMTESEIRTVEEFRSEYFSDSEVLYAQLCQLAYDRLSSDLDYLVDDIDMSSYIDFDEESYSFDEDRYLSTVDDILFESCSDYGISPGDIDYSDLVKNVDSGYYVERYLESLGSEREFDYSRDNPKFSSEGLDPIDDLFCRGA